MVYLKNDSESLLLIGYAGTFFFLPVAVSPLVLCEIFIIAVWILSGRFINDIKIFLKSEIRTPVILLVLLPWIGLMYTPVLKEGLNVALKTHNWLFTIALTPLLQSNDKAVNHGNKKYRDIIIRTFLAGLMFNSTIAILQFLGIVPLKRGMPVGLLGSSSAHIPFGLLLVIGIVISSFYLFKTKRWKNKLIFAFIMIQFFITLSFTESRAGYLALIVLSPFIVYNLTGQKHPLMILTGSIIIISLLFVSPIVQLRVEKIKDDIQQYKNGNVNTSIGQRLLMWKIAIEEIKENPVLGLGTAGFLKAWEQKKKDPALPYFIHGNPHNSFLYMMVNFGILGLYSFCWLLYIMFKTGWKRRMSPLGFSLFTFTAVFIIGSLVDTPLLSLPLAKAFSLFAAIAGAKDAA